jgi:hypothetical protein
MATVDRPRFGLVITEKGKAPVTTWYQTEEARDRAFRAANAHPDKHAKRKQR